jgi:hypothetical protein
MWPTVEGRATPPRVRNRSKFRRAGQGARIISLDVGRLALHLVAPLIAYRVRRKCGKIDLL